MSRKATQEPARAKAPRHPTAEILVSQKGRELSDFFTILAVLFFSSPGGYFVFKVLERDPSGFRVWIGVFLALVGMAVTIVGSSFGYHLWCWLETAWRAEHGCPLFEAKTRVIIDDRGMTVDGLGLAPWADILAYQDHPPKGTTVTVFTRNFGRLEMSAAGQSPLPIQHLISMLERRLRLASLAPVEGGEFDGALQFQAVPFHWPLFNAWIALGILAATAVSFPVAMASIDLSPTVTTIAITCAVTACAAAICGPALAWISISNKRRSRTFIIDGARLLSADGTCLADLHTARIDFHDPDSDEAIFAFVTLRAPGKGRRDLRLRPGILKALRVHIDALRDAAPDRKRGSMPGP